LFQCVGYLASFFLLFCETVIVVLVWFYCEILTISMSFFGWFFSFSKMVNVSLNWNFILWNAAIIVVLFWDYTYFNELVSGGLFLSWNHQYTVVRPGSYVQSVVCLLNSNFTLWNSEILVFLLWDCSYFSELVLGLFHPLTFSM